MEPLTEKQAQILAFIERRLDERKPPSQREIAEHFGVAQNAVCQLLRYLKDKGYLQSQVGGHRGLQLSDAYRAVKRHRQGMPLIGRVAAGEPILAQQNVETYVDLNEFFERRSRDVFVLKVHGDSMVDEGIMDGDYVVVQSQATIEHGQIGVVLLNDEATVKRILLQKDRIGLKPANKKARYRTRYFPRDSQDLRIIGKVIGCFRNM